MDYPEGPTDKAQIDSTQYDSKLLGENELGCVHLHGPFGDNSSDIRIAYVIGMHPLESKSHRALFEKLNCCDDLRYCYYLYNINVRDKNSESEGRLEGQLLAQEFIRDDIIDKGYDLFVDVHSNRGTRGPGEYKVNNFIFAPGFDESSERIMNELLLKIPEIKYYAPEYRTSPAYITEPTAEAGIPTIVYETYSYEPFDTSYELACKLITSVDGLEF